MVYRGGFSRRISASILLLATAQHLLPSYHAPSIFRPVAASGILSDLASNVNERLFPAEDYVNIDVETKTLSIVEISEMRARDIKRRLSRNHGYGADELARMIDKTDLINTLSFEEHKLYQQELDRRKWRNFKTTVIYTCAAVLVVMFWPVIKHAGEVAHVNFVVYTGEILSDIFIFIRTLLLYITADKPVCSWHHNIMLDRRKHELSRCREFNSYKGYFGIFLLFIIDVLTLWLSTSILLSWVMTSKYFFPTPNLPIRPIEMLTPKGHDAGSFGKYGINIGPMIISWFFRFMSGQVEKFIGKAMSEALQQQRKKEKDVMKQKRREERAKEKEAKRAAKQEAKEIAREIARQRDAADTRGDGVVDPTVEPNSSNDFEPTDDVAYSNFDEID